MIPDVLGEILERNAKAVSLRPSLGQKTGTTKVRMKAGLECEITDGPWTLTVGMGTSSGGTNAGPGPGTFGRGALGSCLAMGYAMWAARMGVSIDALEVEVQADYDTRGELGVTDEIPPGYTQVRYIVTISSPASDEEVRKVIDMADKFSPYRDVFARANDVRRELHILHSGA